MQGKPYIDTIILNHDSEFPVSDFERLVQDGVIKGGMIPKVEACVRTVVGGVEKAHILTAESRTLYCWSC